MRTWTENDNWPTPTKYNPAWNQKYLDLPQKSKIPKFKLPPNPNGMHTMHTQPWHIHSCF